MAIITLPATLRLHAISWELDRPSQVNRSAYTGARSVVANPWHGMFRAKADFAPIVGAAQFQVWRGFLFALRGQINTLRLPASEGAQNANSGVTLSANAAANANSVTITGAATAMLPGQMITINNQLLGITAVAGSVLSIEPNLRVAAAAGTAVETANPTALMALVDSKVGWAVSPGQVYAVSLTFEEAF